MTKPNTEIEPLLDANEVARLVGRTQAAMNQLRQRNEGPAYIKIGRNIRYSPAAVREWLDQHTHVPVQRPRRALREKEV